MQLIAITEGGNVMTFSKKVAEAVAEASVKMAKSAKGCSSMLGLHQITEPKMDKLTSKK